MSGTALVRSSADDLDRARRWAQMDPHARRREAFRACRDRDIDGLWRLTEIFLHLHSGAGVNLSKYTSRNYHQALRSFVEDMRDEKLSDPSPTAAAVWRETLRERHLKPSTIKVRLAAVRAMYKALKWATTIQVPEGKQAPAKIDVEMWRNLKPPKDPVTAHAKRSPYPDADVERMLAVADPMERVLILLCAHAGLRISEALAVTWGDVADEGLVIIRHGKGNKSGSVLASRRLVEALIAYRELCSAPALDDYVLPHRTNVWGWMTVKRICERAGVRFRGAHALRHACGTRLARTRPILEVSRHLRHSSVNTSAIYIAWNQDAVKAELAEW